MYAAYYKSSPSAPKNSPFTPHPRPQYLANVPSLDFPRVAQSCKGRASRTPWPDGPAMPPLRLQGLTPPPHPHGSVVRFTPINLEKGRLRRSTARRVLRYFPQAPQSCKGRSSRTPWHFVPRDDAFALCTASVKCGNVKMLPVSMLPIPIAPAA